MSHEELMPPHPPATEAAFRQAAEEDTAFIHELLRAYPSFDPVYREHLRDQGALLPHVLMGDFTRWFIQQCDLAWRAGKASPAYAQVQSLAEFLDAAYLSGRYYVQELLTVSFLENLEQADAEYDLVTSFLGPVLRAELRKLE